MSLFTALFNNRRTLKLKAKPTNVFFAAINQVFDGYSQLTTTAELCSLSQLCTTIWSPCARQQSKAGRSRQNIWLTVAKNAFVSWALNFRVHMLLKGAVKSASKPDCERWQVVHSYKILMGWLEMAIHVYWCLQYQSNRTLASCRMFHQPRGNS